MNYMEQVAQMLGVELEEEFYLQGYDCKYKITNDGLLYFNFSKWVNPSLWLLHKILLGSLEIIKIPKPILDEAEKRYLRNVIKPFRSRVKYIVKRNKNKSECFEDIRVVFESSYQTLFFPYFEKGTMYKGMELDKEYSVEELGL